MKLKGKLLALSFGVLLTLGCAIGFAACGEPEQPEAKTYTVTVTCDEAKGSYTLSPSADKEGKYAEGTSVTLTVTPKADYEVDSVKVNDAAVTPTEEKYTFKVEKDTAVVVAFKDKSVTPPAEEKVNLTLTYTAAQGTVTADPAPVDGKVAKGASVTITVTPAENYEVDMVKVNNSPVELTSNNYTFTADADTTVEVTFKEKTSVPTAYTVTYALGDHAAAGAVVPTAAEATKANDYKVTLPAAPAAAVGYRFVGWQVGTETKDAEAQITVSESITVTAVWAEKNFNQYSDVPVGTWGTVLPRNYLLAKGEAVVLSGSFTEKATTDVYQGIVTQVFAGGDAASGDYYFFRPDCPSKFAGGAWTYWDNSGCTWSTPDWNGDSYKALTEGNVVVTVALSDAGVLTVEVAFTATAYSYTNLYTVTETMESALVFFAADGCTPAAASVKHYTESAPVKYVSLSYEAEQGSVTSDSLPADGKVASGTEVTLTIEPVHGYEIVSVTVNGNDVTSDLEKLPLLPDRPDLSFRDESPKRSLSLGEVTADTAVVVTFRQATHQITLIVEGPGTCQLYDSTVSLAAQTELKDLNAVPSATKVHAVVDWEVSYIEVEFHVNDGETDIKESIVSGNTYFWVVDKDLTVTVTYTINREKAPQNQIQILEGCENGSYTLKAEGGMILEDNVFYGEGEATITLVPDEGYIVESLTLYVDEHYYIPQDVTADLVDNSYTFPVTHTVQLKIKFKKFEATTPDSVYNGQWQCTVKGETTDTTNIAVTATAITITGSSISTISGTPYTATFGYTVYVDSTIEETYEIYLVPGLGDAILALTIDGSSTTYFIKVNPKPTLPEVTINEQLDNSSWFGGAASMPVKFESGKVKIDGVEASVLAGTEKEGSFVYTVYANGGLYQLNWTEEDDSLVLHSYGEGTEDDVPYTREAPPAPVLVPEHAGTYSNNEHTVVIDAEGNFQFDGTVRDLYYEEEIKVYSFHTDVREYTVKFNITGSIQVYNTFADEDWTLSKIAEGTAQYTLTVTYTETEGTVVYSTKNAENKYYAGSDVTLTVTAAQGYAVDKVTVDGEDKTLSAAGKITLTIHADTTVVITFKKLQTDNLLSELYIGVYKSGNTTVTITETGVTVKDTGWSVNVTFTGSQITHTGDGQFTLVNGNKKFTFTFTDDNTKLKVGDPNWAMGGSTKTLTKQEA